jgi:circadian clock protein KaiC
MNHYEETIEWRRDRVSSGVPGLDEVLNGGFLRRGVYMLQGRPGAGKTILANQIAFHHVAEGGRVLYVTLLEETHERMLFNLESLAFFDSSYIPERVTYLSAFSALEGEGLDGLAAMLRREGRTRSATLIVIDGLVAIEDIAITKQEFKKFIHEIQMQASLLDCTILLLTSSEADSAGPEHTMVDGVLDLSANRVGRRSDRELELRKFRGSGYLRGGHAFRIASNGIVVFPRLEALFRDFPADHPTRPHRTRTGMAALDTALGGGVAATSTTVMFGPTGAGKTTLGMQFLDGSTEAEPGLLFGFYETPGKFLAKATGVGLGLESKHERGIVHLVWHPPTERILDALGNELLAAVRHHRVKRLFVDGIDGFQKAAVHPERITHFMTALTNQLRSMGVTTVLSVELRDLFSAHVELPLHGVSSLVENVFLLRFVEQHGEMLRIFSIIKVRDGDYDGAARELRITSKGAELGRRLESTTTGRGQPLRPTPAVRRKRKGRKA